MSHLCDHNYYDAHNMFLTPIEHLHDTNDGKECKYLGTLLDTETDIENEKMTNENA